MGKDKNKFSKTRGVFHHHKKELNKKTKINLVFDPEARKDYLLGFRKRKQARADHYKKKIEKRLADEKKRLREKAKERGKSSSHSVLPEVEDLLDEKEEESQVFEIGSKTITISSLDGIFPKRFDANDEDGEEENLEKKLKYLEDEEVEKSDESEEEEERGPMTKSEMASANKSAVKQLQKTKSFKTMQRLNQSKKKTNKIMNKKKSKKKEIADRFNNSKLLRRPKKKKKR